ncbi:MAG: cytochrome-c peroxidase, partial [Planctomycetota bacterium]
MNRLKTHNKQRDGAHVTPPILRRGWTISAVATAIGCIAIVLALAVWNYPSSATYAVEKRSDSGLEIDRELHSKEPLIPLAAVQAPFTEEAKLGKRIFHDKRLSRDNSISCATCHDVSRGGDDGLRVS